MLYYRTESAERHFEVLFPGIDAFIKFMYRQLFIANYISTRFARKVRSRLDNQLCIPQFMDVILYCMREKISTNTIFIKLHYQYPALGITGPSDIESEFDRIEHDLPSFLNQCKELSQIFDSIHLPYITNNRFENELDTIDAYSFYECEAFLTNHSSRAGKFCLFPLFFQRCLTDAVVQEILLKLEASSRKLTVSDLVQLASLLSVPKHKKDVNIIMGKYQLSANQLKLLDSLCQRFFDCTFSEIFTSSSDHLRVQKSITVTKVKRPQGYDIYISFGLNNFRFDHGNHKVTPYQGNPFNGDPIGDLHGKGIYRYLSITDLMVQLESYISV
jgi:hypothetical protein